MRITNQTGRNDSHDSSKDNATASGRVSAPLAVAFDTDLKRKGASPPVTAQNLRFLTGQLALFRLK